ncbi:TetR family transcriptional regulator, partial [Parvibaculum sp.]|uniref:TetR family transcriptional regulator n=1 Tax=Parvibaculum sp. TaxID=2024848 RepID=UPI00273444AB
MTAGQGKRERTRSALLDAAVEVVAEKGGEAAKISDITTAAGLANGTFYTHFNDKAEILREAAYGIAFEVVRRLDAEMEGI